VNRKAGLLLTIAVGLLSTAVALVTAVHGQEVQNERTLAEIKEFAREMCISVPTEQTSSGVELTGDAKAQVDGLLKKLADLGVTLTAQYQSNRSRGVLQKDLASAIENSNNCRLTLALALSQRLLVPPTVGAYAPTKGRHVTPDQENRLIEVLKNVPPGEAYKATVEVIPDCAECRLYEQELTAEWVFLPRWSVQGDVNPVITPRIGLTLGRNSKQCTDAELKLINDGLTTAGITFHIEDLSDAYCLGTHIRPGYCPLLVGIDE